MSIKPFRISHLGLWAAYAGLALAMAFGVLMMILAFRPMWLAGQEWLVLTFPLTLASIALVFGGLRWFAGFRAAEEIAGQAERASDMRAKRLFRIALPILLGCGLMYLAMRGSFGTALLSLPEGIAGSTLLALLVIGAPMILFVLASLILISNRSRLPQTLEHLHAQKASERRQSRWLLIATPVFVLVPYLAWVSLQ